MLIAVTMLLIGGTYYVYGYCADFIGPSYQTRQISCGVQPNCGCNSTIYLLGDPPTGPADCAACLQCPAQNANVSCHDDGGHITGPVLKAVYTGFCVNGTCQNPTETDSTVYNIPTYAQQNFLCTE
jgi:hypothetical protein